jgi:lysophospholipase L1-like esterase
MSVRSVCVAAVTVAIGCGPAPARSSPYDGEDASVSPSNGPDAAPDAGETSDASLSGVPVPDADAGDSDGAIGNATDDASDAPASTACARGNVTPNEVVMLGDSYFDPVWANTALDIFADAQDAGSLAANTTYRHYYIGAASMGWGNPDSQWFIPYQYDPMAKTDPAVMNPRDIKVIIMDGGGNDVLIGDNSCETTAPPANASCTMTIQSAIAKAQSTLQEVVADGIETIVYLFYPHLDPAGGGILLTPAPTVNEALDYAYPLAEKICCGSSFTSTASNYTCVGTPVPGSKTKCVFVDTRPAFEGHLADYIKDDHVHPSPVGAQVMADLVWNAMKASCVAQ